MPPDLIVDLKTPRACAAPSRLTPARPHNVLARLAWIFGFQRSEAIDLPAPSIRAMGAADIDKLRDFVQGLSARTGYQRLLATRMPTEGDLRRWTSPDGARELALIATSGVGSGERIVGVARYMLGDDQAAEFAVVLSDAWQGRGVGTDLLRRLIESARARGVTQLHGVTLSTNTRMLLLAKRLGFRHRKSPEAAWLTALYLSLAR